MGSQEAIHTFTYKGKWLSINQAYTLHWSKAKKLKDGLKLSFKTMLNNQKIDPLETFTLYLRYNSRLDADNTVTGLKCFVDTLTRSGVIDNDTKGIYQGFTVMPDTTLPNNTYVITIKGKKK